MIYALRFGDDGRLGELVNELRGQGCSEEDLRSIDSLCAYAGDSSRSVGLLKEGLRGITKNIKRGIRGVESPYTEHKPKIVDMLEELQKGKMRDYDNIYPYFNPNSPRDRPTTVILFIVGGVTYEEAYQVASINAAHKGQFNVIIGGSAIVNQNIFVDELKRRGRD
jgi:vacuolar protein sorting-associated protein 45